MAVLSSLLQTLAAAASATEPVRREVGGFVRTEIDCFSTADNTEKLSCSVSEFIVPQTVVENESGSRLKITSKAGKAFWIRASDAKVYDARKMSDPTFKGQKTGSTRAENGEEIANELKVLIASFPRCSRPVARVAVVAQAEVGKAAINQKLASNEINAYSAITNCIIGDGESEAIWTTELSMNRASNELLGEKLDQYRIEFVRESESAGERVGLLSNFGAAFSSRKIGDRAYIYKIDEGKPRTLEGSVVINSKENNFFLAESATNGKSVNLDRNILKLVDRLLNSSENYKTKVAAVSR